MAKVVLSCCMLMLCVTLGKAQALIECESYFGNGKDGEVTVTANTSYYTDNARAILKAGSQIMIDEITEIAVLELENIFSVPTNRLGSSITFSKGDEVLIVQMLGSNVGSAILVTVEAFDGALLKVKSDATLKAKVQQMEFTTTLSPAPDQTYATCTQIIRVPQFRELEVLGNGEVTCDPWNPESGTGGVVCFFVAEKLTIHGEGVVHANGKGYPPGEGGTGGPGGPGGRGGEPGINISPNMLSNGEVDGERAWHLLSYFEGEREFLGDARNGGEPLQVCDIEGCQGIATAGGHGACVGDYPEPDWPGKAGQPGYGGIALGSGDATNWATNIGTSNFLTIRDQDFNENVMPCEIKGLFYGDKRSLTMGGGGAGGNGGLGGQGGGGGGGGGGYYTCNASLGPNNIVRKPTAGLPGGQGGQGGRGGRGGQGGGIVLVMAKVIDQTNVTPGHKILQAKGEDGHIGQAGVDGNFGGDGGNGGYIESDELCIPGAGGGGGAPSKGGSGGDGGSAGGGGTIFYTDCQQCPLSVIMKDGLGGFGGDGGEPGNPRGLSYMINHPKVGKGGKGGKVELNGELIREAADGGDYEGCEQEGQYCSVGEFILPSKCEKLISRMCLIGESEGKRYYRSENSFCIQSGLIDEYDITSSTCCTCYVNVPTGYYTIKELKGTTLYFTTPSCTTFSVYANCTERDQICRHTRSWALTPCECPDNCKINLLDSDISELLKYCVVRGTESCCCEFNVPGIGQQLCPQSSIGRIPPGTNSGGGGNNNNTRRCCCGTPDSDEENKVNCDPLKGGGGNGGNTGGGRGGGSGSGRDGNHKPGQDDEPDVTWPDGGSTDGNGVPCVGAGRISPGGGNFFDIDIRIDACPEQSYPIFIITEPPLDGTTAAGYVGQIVQMQEIGGIPEPVVISSATTYPFRCELPALPIGEYELFAQVYNPENVEDPGYERQILYAIHPEVVKPTIISNATGYVCEGEPVNFYGRTSTLGSIYSWLTPGGNIIDDSQDLQIANVQRSDQGTYELQVSAIGCANNSSSMSMVVHTETPMPVITYDAPVQSGGNLQLYSRVPELQLLSYYKPIERQWFGPQEFASEISNPLIYSITPSNTGYYKVQVKTGTCSAASDSVWINVAPEIGEELIMAPDVICEGDTVHLGLNYDYGTTIRWQGPGGFFSTASRPVLDNVNLTQSGVYVVTITTLGGQVTDSTYLQVNPVPVPRISATELMVCEGESFQLTEVTGSEGQVIWLGPKGYSSISSQISFPQAVLDQGGVYSLIAISQGCASDTQTVQVTVHKLPFLSVNDVNSVCQGGELRLSAIADTILRNYRWQGPEGFTSFTRDTTLLNVNLNQDGQYTLTAEGDRCEVSSWMEVRIDEPVVLDTMSIAIDTLTCEEGATVTLSVPLTIGIWYAWYDRQSGELLSNGNTLTIEGLPSRPVGLSYLLKLQYGDCTKELTYEISCD